MAPQHGSLSPERWGRFPPERRLLMIANEMNRTRKRCLSRDVEGLLLGCERVLALVDLTVEVTTRRALRRELLRWRDLVAALHASRRCDLDSLDRAFRGLLSLAPSTHAQTAHLLPSR
jgi:hypothetical protein